MVWVRIVSGLGGVILLASIIWAAQTAGQSLGEAIAWLVSGPWGVVSLIDLYLGFVFIAIFIWVLEPRKWIALLFILPLPFLGNVWPAVWIVWRLGQVVRERGNIVHNTTA